MCQTFNAIYGTTSNAYDTRRTAGGSSGGEGALIAARGSPLGIGTDIGGSVRIPCHFCGLCGFKPTSGRLSYKGISIPRLGDVNGQGHIVHCTPTPFIFPRCTADPAVHRVRVAQVLWPTPSLAALAAQVARLCERLEEAEAATRDGAAAAAAEAEAHRAKEARATKVAAAEAVRLLAISMRSPNGRSCDLP